MAAPPAKRNVIVYQGGAATEGRPYTSRGLNRKVKTRKAVPYMSRGLNRKVKTRRAAPTCHEAYVASWQLGIRRTYNPQSPFQWNLRKLTGEQQCQEELPRWLCYAYH